MDLHKELLGYLEYLDNSMRSKIALFEDETTAKAYESFLWFAFNKVLGSRYHYSQVKSYSAEESDTVIEQISNIDEDLYSDLSIARDPPGARITRIEKQTCGPAEEYSFELTAFLQSLRSSLDFIARIYFFHLKGMQGDSVSHLVRLLDRGYSSTLLQVIQDHLDWLVYIRDYRDDLVHRFIISLYSGALFVKADGLLSGGHFPTVIPSEGPEFSYETRESRLARHSYDDQPVGLIKTERTVKRTNENGIDELIEMRITFEPAPGFVEIQKFMSDNLERCEQFWMDSLHALRRLSFQYDEVQKNEAS
jgi:hypothetical protein